MDRKIIKKITVKELKLICINNNIKGYSKLKKKDILQMLEVNNIDITNQDQRIFDKFDKMTRLELMACCWDNEIKYGTRWHRGNLLKLLRENKVKIQFKNNKPEIEVYKHKNDNINIFDHIPTGVLMSILREFNKNYRVLFSKYKIDYGYRVPREKAIENILKNNIHIRVKKNKVQIIDYSHELTINTVNFMKKKFNIYDDILDCINSYMHINRKEYCRSIRLNRKIPFEEEKVPTVSTFLTNTNQCYFVDGSIIHKYIRRQKYLNIKKFIKQYDYNIIECFSNYESYSLETELYKLCKDKKYNLINDIPNLEVKHFQNKNTERKETELYLLCENREISFISNLNNLHMKYFQNKTKDGRTELSILCENKMENIIELLSDENNNLYYKDFNNIDTSGHSELFYLRKNNMNNILNKIIDLP